MGRYFTNEWYIFHQVFDKETCDKIKKLVQGKWVASELNTQTYISEEERKTGMKGDYKTDSNLRNSDLFWTTEQWVYDLTFPYMEEANRETGWNLDIKAAESMQITRYKKGGFFCLHKDGFSDSLSAYNIPDNKFLHGNVRKISMTMLLNDNFEGGALEFACYSEGKCEIRPIEPKIGDIIFFTSGMEHRVAPITKGVRYSLVNWFVGPPLK